VQRRSAIGMTTTCDVLATIYWLQMRLRLRNPCLSVSLGRLRRRVWLGVDALLVRGGGSRQTLQDSSRVSL
jgi:hypothetical protein